MMDLGATQTIPAIRISPEEYERILEHLGEKKTSLRLPPVDIELIERMLNAPYEAWKKRHG